MTQTIRRELRLKFKQKVQSSEVWLSAACNWEEKGVSSETTEGWLNQLLDSLADAALEVKGIAKPTARFDRTDEEQAALDKKKLDDILPVTQKDIDDVQRREEIANLYEQEMGYNPLAWWTNDKLMKLLKFLLTKTPDEIKAFAKWSKRDFSTFDPVKAKRYPLDVIEFWPLAFEKKTDDAPSTPKPGGFYA